jgi:hypothetical protein
MRIEQTGKRVFQPITITLQSPKEAEIVMAIMSRIGGDMYESPRFIADEIYSALLNYGIEYRDDSFQEKLKVRGSIIFENFEY